jgi:ABC-2 type transport system permease protein
MTRLVRAELLKIRTVRTFLWIVLANIALVLITSISVAASEDAIQDPQDDRAVAQIAGIAIVLALIAGIVVMAGEAKHGTITQTLLVTPVRERVLLVKAIIAALLGMALAVLAEALVLAITVPAAGLDFHNARLTLLGVLLAAGLAGALGAGFGAVVHAQGAAIGISLVWLLVGENLALVISESATKYTPGRTFAALASGDRTGGGEVLGMGGGVVAAGVWAALFLGAGLLAFLGRDV